MQRRAFLILSTASSAMGRVAVAQAPKILPTVGYLSGAFAARSVKLVQAFHEGLADIGYVEGRNVAIEWRWADDHYERLPDLANELVRRAVTVIAATSTPVALAAKAASARIPIVFTIGNDPVKVGLVRNLSRPDGNVTGVTRLNVELGPKRLQLLHQAVPSAKMIALLLNPDNPDAKTFERELGALALTLRLQLNVFLARGEVELEPAFQQMKDRHAEALLIGADPIFNSEAERLGRLTLRHALPAMYQYADFPEAGGLMSYGASNVESHERMGVYCGRILRGARPSDLPVEQSSKIELIVNIGTAHELGLTIPSSLLGRADRILQ
jgi:putative ABC transport system substrate-binding protein